MLNPLGSSPAQCCSPRWSSEPAGSMHDLSTFTIFGDDAENSPQANDGHGYLRSYCELRQDVVRRLNAAASAYHRALPTREAEARLERTAMAIKTEYRRTCPQVLQSSRSIDVDGLFLVDPAPSTPSPTLSPSPLSSSSWVRYTDVQ
mmetsp:Transcript_30274/g.85565  ORF Transcript_30274/g.85565 Transcript_30274/m.85565 type:complete len:147 (+) Transcript_30274:308-748(+)